MNSVLSRGNHNETTHKGNCIFLLSVRTPVIITVIISSMSTGGTAALNVLKLYVLSCNHKV